MGGVLLSAAGLAGFVCARLLGKRERLSARAETLLSLTCIALEAAGLMLLIF